jgi:hypothetical protein
VIDEVKRLGPVPLVPQNHDHVEPVPATPTWGQRDCEHKELPISTPDNIVNAMVRARRANGRELHPTTECDGRTITYIVTRRAKR